MDIQKGEAVSQTAKTAPKRARQAKKAPVATRPASPAPTERVRAVASEYPFALMLGGVALGVIAGALLPRSVGRRLGKAGMAAAAVAGELGLAYGRKALEQAGTAASSLDEAKDAVAANAADYSRRAADLMSEAGRIAADAAGEALGSARDASHKIGQQAIRLRSHLRH
jgi:hypothetical protein